MTRAMAQALAFSLYPLLICISMTAAAQGPLRIEITEGVIEPLPFAVPTFIARSPDAADLAVQITEVVAADLENTGLFREIPSQAHISTVTSFDSPVQFSDWKAINAQALVTGSVDVTPDGLVTVMFRVFDVFSERSLGQGLRLSASRASSRRLAHKIADEVYSRITGEGGYFDSRVAFISEAGPKDARRKRVAVMDYDGANVRFLTDDSTIVLAPRFSPKGDTVLYTSYETGRPKIYVIGEADGGKRALGGTPGTMTFAPRFSPDGSRVVFSLSQGGNTDIFSMSMESGAVTRLTANPAIETAPGYSPDGEWIVFESDRSGTQQLYIMPAEGGEASRISYGPGRYGTPVWSPRGDLIAFTKQRRGRFHIGVMRTDGSEERLLTASFLDEGPTWSPNGRVIMFTRENRGSAGAPALYSVDISGRNLRRVPVPGAASDPSWSPLLR